MTVLPYPNGKSDEFVQIGLHQNNNEADLFYVPVQAARVFALEVEKMTRPAEYPRFYSEFEVDLLLKERHTLIDELNEEINDLIDRLNKAHTKSLLSYTLPVVYPTHPDYIKKKKNYIKKKKGPICDS